MKAAFPALAAALLLTACGAEQKAPEADAGNDAATVSEAPPAAPAAPTPERTEWTLTSEGLGPLRIGMTREEIVAAAGPDADPEAVGGPDPEACDQFRPANAPEGVLAMVESGRLTRISLIRESALKTDHGIGLGVPASQVRRAYGSALTETPHKYVEAPAAYLTLWDKGGDAGASYVQNPDARGIVFEIGREGRVQAIHAGGPSIQYVEGCA